jgi:hypothetical protein
MKLIFNHDEDAVTQHNHSQKILQASHVVKGGTLPSSASQMGSGSVPGSKTARKKGPTASSRDLQSHIDEEEPSESLAAATRNAHSSGHHQLQSATAEPRSK